MFSFVATYVHRIDPYALRLWDGGPIRWYGLSYLAGFIVAYWLIRRVAQTGRSTLQPQDAADLVITIAVGIVVGGRLGYAIFYKPEILWTFTQNLPFWDLLALNKGGMASHGGMIGAIVATKYYAVRRSSSKHQWPHILDLVAFAAPLGLFFGRIANFINGELIGRPCSPNLPWAVKFPHEMYTWSHEQLTHIFRIIDGKSLLSNALPLNLDYRLSQVIDQIQMGNKELTTIIEPLLTPRHPSQIYQALLEGLLLFVILAIAWAKPKKPWLITGLFCSTYAILRIISEYFREPDTHIGLQWLGLTRGQWLSVFLFLIGIAILFVVTPRQNKPIGGWRMLNEQA